MTGKKRALLIINRHKPNALILAEEINAELGRRDMEVTSYSFGREDVFQSQGSYDISFSLGGDGTVLYLARIAAPLGTPILPVNFGALGFIAAVHPDEWLEVFNRWAAGEAAVSPRLMLEIAVERRGEGVFLSTCLNDAVISAAGIAKLIALHVEGEHSRLGQYRSDGLIVATPTGSTAYSAAAGGPILDPEMEAVIINPICPFTLSSRPIVMPAHENITVEIEEEQRSGVLLTVDGQDTFDLEPGDRIRICRTPYQARLIAADRRLFYKALRTKLNWSGGSHA